MLGDLPFRSTAPEMMDDPNLSSEALAAAFVDINRCNTMLGGNRITIQALAKLVKAHPKPSYTVVDMGCGDGSMLREVVLFCRKKKLKVNAIGIDLSEKAIAIAKKKSVTFPEIRYQIKDILSFQPQELACDILLSTLTMHHFKDEEILVFLQQFQKLSRIGFIINDLQRSRWACYLFKLFRRIFIKTIISKNDGLISIQRGFTKKELENFARILPTATHYIAWKWAFRYVWVMQSNRLS